MTSSLSLAPLTAVLISQGCALVHDTPDGAGEAYRCAAAAGRARVIAATSATTGRSFLPIGIVRPSQPRCTPSICDAAPVDDAAAARELEGVPLDLPAGLEATWLGVSGYRLTY